MVFCCSADGTSVNAMDVGIAPKFLKKLKNIGDSGTLIFRPLISAALSIACLELEIHLKSQSVMPSILKPAFSISLVMVSPIQPL